DMVMHILHTQERRDVASAKGVQGDQAQTHERGREQRDGIPARIEHRIERTAEKSPESGKPAFPPNQDERGERRAVLRRQHQQSRDAPRQHASQLCAGRNPHGQRKRHRQKIKDADLPPRPGGRLRRVRQLQCAAECHSKPPGSRSYIKRISVFYFTVKGPLDAVNRTLDVLYRTAIRFGCRRFPPPGRTSAATRSCKRPSPALPRRASSRRRSSTSVPRRV